MADFNATLVYGANGAQKTVRSAEELAALGPEWHDSPKKAKAAEKAADEAAAAAKAAEEAAAAAAKAAEEAAAAAKTDKSKK